MAKEKSPADPLPVRPHHGMCLAFFRGSGYSSRFVSGMSEVLSRLLADPETVIRLTCGADRICSACPENLDGVCLDHTKSGTYDGRVLALTQLSYGQELTFAEFAARVTDRILNPGLRADVCSDCRWDGICSGAASNYDFLER